MIKPLQKWTYAFLIHPSPIKFLLKGFCFKTTEKPCLFGKSQIFPPFKMNTSTNDILRKGKKKKIFRMASISSKAILSCGVSPTLESPSCLKCNTRLKCLRLYEYY